MEMTGLRVSGLLIGVISIIMSFRFFRGTRWNRFNFCMSALFSIFLIVISLHPTTLDSMTSFFSLKKTGEQRGRIILLMIGAIFYLLFLTLYLKQKIDEQRQKFNSFLLKHNTREADEHVSRELVCKDIVVIIPAFNEAENLKRILPNIPQCIDGKKVGVLVIDDGSVDGTAELVRTMGYMVAQNIMNCGQGSALRLGYNILMKYNITIGLTMDADGQHLPDDIEPLVKPILSNTHDLVIGSRVLGRGEKTTIMRSAGVRIFSRFISLLVGVRLTDCSSGFKAFNIEAMKRLHLREDQFQAAEIIIDACKKGLRVGEVPITITHRKYGDSKKGRDLQYGFNFTKSIIKAWWR